MAGGVGERFWPLSRRRRPKQLLDLTGRGSMIRLTVERLSGLSGPDETFVITNVDQRDAIIEEIGPLVASENVIAEPQGRNTAPCIGLAALLMRGLHGDQPMLVLPADHIVEPVDEFQRHVRAGAQYVASNDVLLTFGIRPTRPETGYGYVRATEVVFEQDGITIREAREFLEKPSASSARTFVEDGDYFWNSGMFMWTTSTILREIGLHLPELSRVLTQIDASMGTRSLDEVLHSLYAQAPSISIDYGVMEKAQKVVVLEADFSWNDVGSWEFLRDIHPADKAGNVALGDHVFIDAAGNTVVSPDRLVALVGIDDVVVVDGGDTILVCRRDRVQEVKEIVRTLRDRERDDLI